MSGGSDEMAQNVIDILKQEHEMVLSMLSELASKGISGREQKYESLKENLMPHMIGEEQALYPRLKEEAEMRDMVLESIEEHGAVKTLPLADSASSSEEMSAAKLKVIQENVDHHISEEEDEIFPRMQQKMSCDEPSSLGSRYE